MSIAFLKRSLFVAVVALSCVICSAKDVKSIKVTPVEHDADAANSGVVYSLPKTQLRIRVDAELTIEKAGPFYKYSNKFLNISDVITEDSKSWKVVSASVETFSVADPSKRYKIFSETGTLLPCISLTKDGVLRGINLVSCNISDGKANRHSHGTKQKVRDNIMPIDDVDFASVQLSQQVLTKTSTAAMAEQVAQSIYSLRDKRLAILGGEESTLLADAGSYDKVLAELDRLEKEHLELFVGKRKVVKVTRYFTLEPSAENEVIARFSEKDGFLNAMDLTGKPIYVEVITSPQVALNSLPDNSKQRKASPLNGLRYYIPAHTTVRVLDRNNLLVEKEVLTSQGGQIVTLPESYLLNESTTIKLDATTGALISISTNKENK